MWFGNKVLLSKQEKSFIWCALFCAFFISLEYGITRPACNALFLSTYSSKIFPYAWLATVPLNFLIVYIYNRLLPSLGCLKTFSIVVFSIGAINTFFALFLHKSYYFPFIQFIWKDVYILLMFKQLWSLAHTMVSTEKAKLFYGLMMGVGGLGSVIGGIVSAFLAVRLGSQNLFFFTAFIYFLLFLAYKAALKQNPGSSTFQEKFAETGVSISSVVSLIRNSKLLILTLSLVVFMQVSVALVDYQFNIFMENAIPTVDKRTQYMGWLLSVTNGVTVVLQFLGTYLFLQLFGLKKSHLFVPILLNFNAVFLLLFPSFSVASCAFITIKTMDYSFFTVIREMLYIPMKVDEKFRAKAIIDVFAYRTAKAFASLFLLFAQAFLSWNLLVLTGCMSIVVFFVWIIVISYMFHHYEKRVEAKI